RPCQPLTSHAVADAQLQFFGRKFRHPGGEDRPRVVLRLEQAGDVEDGHLPQERGVVIQFSEIQERRGQVTPVLLPPALGAVGGHHGQGRDELRVRAGVVGRETAYPLLTHAGGSGLDLTGLHPVHPEQRSRLDGGEACRFAEPAQLDPEAHLTCGWFTPEDHQPLPVPTRLSALPIRVQITRSTCLGLQVSHTVSDATHTVRHRATGSAPLRPALAAAAMTPGPSLPPPQHTTEFRMSENAPWEYSLHLPNDVRAVTVSRRTLRLMLTMHGLIGLVDVAELLATELVSNAVRHTKGPAALRVHWSPPGTLRIGAWDADPRPPEPPQPFMQAAGREDGRGLALVRACADVWGWQPLARDGSRGKYVWCELAAA